MRANFYVDGYNFYCGLCDAGLHGNIWINLQNLCEHLIRKHEELGRIRYFTCLPYHDSRKLRDHRIYISALEKECSKIEIFYGDFAKAKTSAKCKNCGLIFELPIAVCPSCGWKKKRVGYVEKQTDVSLAVNLVRDAFDGDFDVAYIISGDTDLIPAIKMARAIGGHKNQAQRFGIFFPPSREHEGFRGVVDFAIPIRPHEIKVFQLPDPVRTNSGELPKPSTWSS